MSGKSHVSSHFVNVFVAKAPNYYPRHLKPGATRAVSARAAFSVFSNAPNRTRQDGTRNEGRTDVFRIIAWGPMADIVAKHCTTGKCVCFDAMQQSYDAVIRVNNQIMTDQTGKPLPNTAVNFVLTPGTWRPGDDSQKQIDSEINGVFGPNGEVIQAPIRPVNWNTQQHPDYNIWRQKLAERNNTVFQPNLTTFGFAKVIIPEGVTVVDLNDKPLYAGTPPSPVGTGMAPPPPAQGVTLTALHTAGWTDAQILADPQWAPLLNVAPTPVPNQTHAGVMAETMANVDTDIPF